ncbi:unnamed protein product [Alopecurus aequalis]
MDTGIATASGFGAGCGVDESTRGSSPSAAVDTMDAPSRGSGGGSLSDICGEVFKPLVARGHLEAAAVERVAAFRAWLQAHFARLPARYQHYVDIDKAEDVLIHLKVLEEAKYNARRPAFHSQHIKMEGLDGETSGESTGISHRQIHEVTFGAIDKPRLLSQLSCLLHDSGLNIRDIDVFSTKDGYCLATFVIDGAFQRKKHLNGDTTCLDNALESSILIKDGKFYFKRVRPRAERRVKVNNSTAVKKRMKIQKLTKDMMGHFHAVMATEISLLLPMMTAFFAIDSPLISVGKGSVILVFILCASISLFGFFMSSETADSRLLPVVRTITLYTSICSLALVVHTLAVFLPNSNTNAEDPDWMHPFSGYFSLYGGVFLIGSAVLVMIWRSMFVIPEVIIFQYLEHEKRRTGRTAMTK